MGGLFIGSVEEFEKHQAEIEKNGGAGGKVDANVRRIAYDNMEPISDEDLLLLKRTKVRNDYDTVYMQSNPNFYDEFYNWTGSVEDSELVAEAKKIKRVYKSYPRYLYAMYIRNLYIDKVVEKYGGEDAFNFAVRAKMMTDWMPPRPILSKNSPDREQYELGRIEINTIDEDTDIDRAYNLVESYVDDTEQETGCKISDMSTLRDVETNPVALKYFSDDTTSYRPSPNNDVGGVNINQLVDLQALFRSWYKTEDTTKKTKNYNIFANTPDAIKDDFYKSLEVNMGNIKYGQEIEEEELDMNEMVMDPVLNRPMTRGEQKQREFIRLMKDAGWSDVRLMRHLGVGSKYERQLMYKKKKRRAKSKRSAVSIAKSMMGIEDLGLFDSTEQMRGALFDD